ncbi:MAG: GNAT family N-acetyltransferase [Bacteroidaceae bacterium]|nr:GNAT family N-acetyltransferase [Bacteroidaceae bacterium]
MNDTNNEQTKRLIFRRWQETDANTLYKYASDPEVGPRAGWEPHKSVEESLETIRTIFGGETMWAVVLKDTNEPIGCIGYLPKGTTNIEVGENEVEVGYWIARPYWNLGICTEALTWMIDYCFNVKGITALWSDFFIDNPASGRVMEKCGFTDTGIETLCPDLYGGADRLVRIKKLVR